MNAVPLQPAFNPFPLAVLAASFAVGVLLARLFSPALMKCVICGAAMTLLTIFAFAKHKSGLASLCVTSAFLLVGAVMATAEKASAAGGQRLRSFYEGNRIASGAPVEVTGALRRAPEFAPDGFYLTLRVDALRFKGVEQSARGTVELFVPVRDQAIASEYEALELRRGARVRVMTALTRAASFRNPGVTPLSEYLEQRGLDAVGTIKSPLLVERLDDERVFLPLVWLDRWRARLLTRTNELFSSDAAGVLNAAMLGNRHGLARATAERFRVGGTFHVLVISGLHITLIGGLVWALMRRVTKRRGLQWILSVVFVWGYAIAVGAESSVVRAALMFTLIAFAPVLHRHSNSVNALGGAALVLLVWRPSELFSPSFQLTFLSVLIILTLAWPLLAKLKTIGEWRPTRATPHPPVCPSWWRVLGETLFWSERRWRREMHKAPYSYQLFKTPLAARVERIRIQPLLRYAFAAMLVSLCVQLGLLPLLVLYFHRFSPAAVVLNVVVGILMALLSVGALAALLVSQLYSQMAGPLVALTEKINSLMVHTVDPFAAAGVAQLRLPEYAGWPGVVYVLYFVPLAIFAVALARWQPIISPIAPDSEDTEKAAFLSTRFAIVLFIALLIVIVAHPFSAGWPDGKLRVDFLDVGQGDAALVTMPDGTNMLIDGGGRPRFDTSPPARGENDDDEAQTAVEKFERDARSIGEAVVSEYLWWRGLDHVDYVLATHSDADHINGLNDVVRNFKVRAALIARAPADNGEFARFSATLDRFGVPAYIIGSGDALHFGAVTAEVLWPPHARESSVVASASSSNNSSAVLRLRFKEKNILFTGDIESEAEAGLLEATPESLRCDAIKVAHHGSKTSSIEFFVVAARPSLAIVSVGLSSPFGHPDAGVAERWRASGAKVLTTGECGTITLSTDGRGLTTETYVRK